MHVVPGVLSYLNSVTGQISGHAASAILDGQLLVSPLEGGGLLRVEFLVVLCMEMCIFRNLPQKHGTSFVMDKLHLLSVVPLLVLKVTYDTFYLRITASKLNQNTFFL